MTGESWGPRRRSVLAFNGSASVQGDSQIALAALEAMHTEHDVAVITVAGEFADEAAALGLQVVIARGAAGEGSRVRSFLRSILLATYGLRELLRRRADLIYTYDRTAAADVALVLGALARRPVAFHVNQAAMHAYQRSRYAMARRFAEMWFVSRSVQQLVTTAGAAGSYRVILNCLRTLPAPRSKSEAREELAVAPGAPVVVTVGRLSPFKGQETFIRAFAEEPLASHHARGYIVGFDTGEGQYDSPPHPDYSAFLSNLITSLGLGARVSLLGRRPGPVAFAAADVACVLSDAEPFGLVVAEAAAMGTPLVAARSGALPELVTHEQGALLVPPRDAAAAAAAIVRMLDEPGLAAGLASTAQADLRVRLSFERYTADILAAVSDLCAP